MMVSNRFGGLAAVAGSALLVGVILATEREWVIMAALAAGVVITVLAERNGIGERIATAFDSDARVLSMFLMLAGLAVSTVLHEEHFALLMLATVFVYGLACLGLTIQYGYAGVLNFAGAAFFGIGGYTAAVLGEQSGIPSPLIVVAGGAVAALISSVLILPVLRTKGHYAALITIAFGILFQSFLEVNDTFGGPQGLKVSSMKLFGWDLLEGLEFAGFEASYYYNYVLVTLVAFAVFLFLVKRLERSWVGMNLDAVREDEIAASVFGINVANWQITAFVLGNFVIGVAGAIYGMMTSFVAPTSFTFGDSLLMLAIIILGGIGNPWGVLPAAVLVLVIPEKLQVIGEYRVLVFAILVVLVLRFRPEGLFPRGLRIYKDEVSR